MEGRFLTNNAANRGANGPQPSTHAIQARGMNLISSMAARRDFQIYLRVSICQSRQSFTMQLELDSEKLLFQMNIGDGK